MNSLMGLRDSSETIGIKPTRLLSDETHYESVMFDYTKVDTAVERIINHANPKMIIIFGSVARREARDDSDLDILVVFDEVIDQKRMYYDLSGLFIGLKLPFDLIIMNYDDFNHYKENNQSFTYEIVSTGEVVYAQ